MNNKTCLFNRDFLIEIKQDVNPLKGIFILYHPPAGFFRSFLPPHAAPYFSVAAIRVADYTLCMNALSVLALLILLLPSCSPSPPRQQISVQGRPSPAYTQWLESQACLRKAPQLASIVSGTAINWLENGSGLTGKAKVWAVLSPSAFPGDKNAFFKALGQDGLLRSLADLGAEGLFLRDAAENTSLLSRAFSDPRESQAAVSFDFGAQAGSERDYGDLFSLARAGGIDLGGELLPAATGAGADFVLGCMGVRDYPGMYVMAEIPREHWALLPDPGREISPLSKDSAGLLAENKLLPGTMLQDDPSLTGIPSGWAATGIRQGIDGVGRRWIYRWYGRPESPVLNWRDPSAAARRVLEASLINQAGIRHQALVGIRAGAWVGMNADDGDSKTPSLEPALSAIRDLSASARRYGSELLLEDHFPPEILPEILPCSAGFVRDGYACPSLEESIGLHNAAPLRTMLQKALADHADIRRLWHSAEEVFPSPRLFLSGGAATFTEHGLAHAGAPLKYASGAMHVPHGQETAAPPARTKIAHQQADLRKAILACLPGLLLLGEDDVLPFRPLPSGKGISAGSLPGTSPAAEHRQFLKKLIGLRAGLGLPDARLLSLPASEHPCVFNMLLALPDGRSLLFSGNLSLDPVRDPVSGDVPHLPWINARTGARELANAPLAALGWRILVSP